MKNAITLDTVYIRNLIDFIYNLNKLVFLSYFQIIKIL